jgi:hypothetical protein
MFDEGIKWDVTARVTAVQLLSGSLRIVGQLAASKQIGNIMSCRMSISKQQIPIQI